MLDVGIAILKFANSDFGQLVIKVGLVIGAITLLHTGMLKLQGVFVSTSIVQYTSALVGLVAQYGFATTATTLLADAVEYLNLALMKNPFVLIATAIVGTIVAINKYQEATLATRETTEELNDAITDLKNNITESESNIESITNKLDQLNKQKLNITDENKLNILNEEEASLERQLKIEQKKLEVTRQELELKAKATLQEKQSSDNLGDLATDKFSWTSYGADGKSTKSSINGRNVFSDFETEKQWLKDLKDYYLDLADSKREIEQANAEMSNSYAENKDKIEANNLALQQIEEQMGKVSQKGLEIAENINNATSALDENDESSKGLIDTNNEEVDSFLNVIGANSELNESLNESAEVFDNLSEAQQEDLYELLEAHGELGEHLEEIAKKMAEEGVSAEEAAESLGNLKGEILTVADAQKELDSAMSNLTSMASNYDLLTKAMNEYNNGGAITLDTLSKLTALGSDWVGLLEVENGTMSINEKGLKNLANAYINDAEAKAYDKAIADLNKIAEDNLTASKRDGINVSNSSANASVNASQRAGHAAKIAGNQAETAGNKWMVAWKKVANRAVSSNKVTKKQANQVTQNLETTIDALEKARKSFQTNTVAAVKNTGAVSSNSKARGGNSKATKANSKAVDDNTKALKANVDALKEQKEALEKEVDDYKKVIGYLNDKVDEEIDKLEEARDKEIQVIEDRIDYYEDLADKEEEVLNGRIDNLKDARDAEKDYWDDKIQALKDTNEVIEDQIELEKLLQNLENARRKKVKVYREGKGFVYETDQDEVAKAKKELEDYQNQKALEDQINLLKKNRDDALSVYDKQIADLEDYKKRQKAKYDAIIEDLKKQVEQIKAKYDVPINALKEWKETFKKQTEAYEQEIARQLTIQKTGIDTESANWTTRLNNLDAFVSAYNAKLKELDDVNSKLESAEKAYNQAQQSASSYDYDDSGDGDGGDGGGGGGGGGGSYEPSAPKTGNYKVLKFEKKFSNKTNAQKYIESLPVSKRGQYAFLEHGGAYYVYKKSNYKSYQGITESQAANYAQAYRGSAMYWAYASGAAKIGSNQMALVGDDPKHRELVIGSKLNGIAMQLSKGSGVVNAKSTNTFAGLLNALGSALNDGSAKGSILNNNSDNSSSMYIDKVVIEGSHITDIVSFKNSLMNLKSEATQRAYKHK